MFASPKTPRDPVIIVPRRPAAPACARFRFCEPETILLLSGSAYAVGAETGAGGGGG